MKKTIISLVALAAVASVANAATNMCVKTDDGKVIRYAVDYISEVFYRNGVSETGQIDGYAYVDLDLPSGTKWATYNVGATNIGEIGGYFAWGETNAKTTYSLTNYRWNNVETDEQYTKYNSTKDYKLVLEAEDDAATAIWGDNWRMPTIDELSELKDGCYWESTDNFNGTGVAGLVGTSKNNFNTIFLPASGFYNEDSLYYFGKNAYYWTSELSGADMYDYAGSLKQLKIRNQVRFYGQNIRAVAVNKKSYTVRFFNADSTLFKSQVVEEGKAANAVVAPAMNGYSFNRWSDSSFTRVVRDLDVYALYKKVANVTVSGVVDAHEYVDLGLSVKWATCNVGASSVCAYGNYYAWGETEPKMEDAPYKWMYDDDPGKYSKYNTTDNKTVLDTEDDAASANWGEGWRMPTNEELTELVLGCSWEWTDNYNNSGISGQIGTSKKNGNIIFLPAAGTNNGYGVGKNGEYWSSSFNYDNVLGDYACIMAFNATEFKYKNMVSNRPIANVVRAVVK